jgi:hypothetical protein
MPCWISAGRYPSNTDHKLDRGLIDDRMLNRIDVPGDILESKELRAMGLSVNKLLIS